MGLESVNTGGLRHWHLHCEGAQLKASKKQSKAATNGKDDAFIQAANCVSARVFPRSESINSGRALNATK